MADRLKTIRYHLQDQVQNTNNNRGWRAEQTHVHSNTTSASASVAGNSTFRYTVDGPKLTPEQRAFYEENGFVVIKRLVDPEKLDVFRERFIQICKRDVTVPYITVMRDVAIKDSEFVAGEQAITKIQDWQQDDIMFTYCCLPEILSYVDSFTGPDIMAIHTMLINKPPDAGKKTSRHPMHQDLYYFPFRPADRIVCSWTAMQTVNRENGCLVVVPGSHRQGKILAHVYPQWEGGVNKMYHGIQNYDSSSPRVHLEMEEGDTVFFHPLLIHGSGVNRTKNFRKSISCHFADSKSFVLKELDCEQQTIKDEVMALKNKKFGKSVDLSFQDIWKLKSRHVKGEENLVDV